MSKSAHKRTKPRAESKQQSHAALIAAGIAEFSRHGLDASLDSICARAKLTRGAFYVHFADRDAFIVAVMEHVLGTFVAALTGVETAAPSLDAAIRVFFAAAQSRAPVITGAPGIRFHHLIEACRRSRKIGTRYRSIVMTGRDRLAMMIERDQHATTIRTDRTAAALADVLLVAVFGVISVLELEMPIDLARLGESLIGVVQA